MSNPSSAITAQGIAINGIVEKTVNAAFVASSDKITRAAGSWITDGFTVGMAVTTNDGDTANAAGGVITALTATDMTLAASLTDVAAASKIITGRALVGEVKSFQGPGGQAADIDVTSLQSTAKEFRRGLQDEGEISFDVNLVPDDVGQLFCRVARAEVGSPYGKRTFEIVLPDDDETTLTFEAFVKGFSISGGVDDVVKAAIALRVTGAVDWS